MKSFMNNRYSGNVSLTNHGHTCIPWGALASSFIYFDADDYILGSSNYCRQLETDIFPWCYVEDSLLSWEYCSFTICSGIYYVCVN